MSFQITSTAFSNGASIAKNHTCDGPDVSPSLNWTGAPAGTQSFALIADDPDAPAGTWYIGSSTTCLLMPRNSPKE